MFLNHLENIKQMMPGDSLFRPKTKTDSQICLNFTKIDFNKTMGVLSVGLHLLELVKELCETNQILICVDDQFANSKTETILATQLHTRKELYRYTGIEIMIHQFQEPVSNKAALLVHDFHPFDIPWKYKDSFAMQKKILNNIYNSKVVFSHFPLTHKRLVELKSRPNALYLPLGAYNVISHESDLSNISYYGFQKIKSWQGIKIYHPAQFQPHKNHATVLYTIKELINVGMDPLLIGTGSIHDVPYYESMMQLRDELELEQNSLFLGFVSDSDVSDIYRYCDLVIQSGAAEGGAYIAQEALSHGKIPLVADTPASRAHLKALKIKDILYTPDCPNDLAAKLQHFTYQDSIDSLFAELRLPTKKDSLNCIKEIVTLLRQETKL